MANPYEDLGRAIEAGESEKTARLLNDNLVITAEYFKEATVREHYTEKAHLLTLSRYAIKDREFTKWFLDHGADPNKRCHLRDYTPLSYAVRDAPFDIIMLLLEEGGGIRQGQLLHYAAMRNKGDSFQVLSFTYDQDPNLTNHV
ncbi:hypothetical protein BDW69DRAFT_184736 [Aspergillus filifer]